jgi:hypothetical protein
LAVAAHIEIFGEGVAERYWDELDKCEEAIEKTFAYQDAGLRNESYKQRVKPLLTRLRRRIVHYNEDTDRFYKRQFY